MYVTGYYTTVAMVIIHEYHLPPFLSVSRKQRIPSSSRQHGGRWGELKWHSEIMLKVKQSSTQGWVLHRGELPLYRNDSLGIESVNFVPVPKGGIINSLCYDSYLSENPPERALTGCLSCLFFSADWHGWPSSWRRGQFLAKCIWKAKDPKASWNRNSKQEEAERGVLTASIGMRVPVSSMVVQMKHSVVPEAQGPLSTQTIQSQRKGSRNDRMRGWWLLFFLSRNELVKQR